MASIPETGCLLTAREGSDPGMPGWCIRWLVCRTDATMKAAWRSGNGSVPLETACREFPVDVNYPRGFTVFFVFGAYENYMERRSVMMMRRRIGFGGLLARTLGRFSLGRVREYNAPTSNRQPRELCSRPPRSFRMQNCWSVPIRCRQALAAKVW